MRRSVFIALLMRGVAAAAKVFRTDEQQVLTSPIKLPVTQGSVRFAIIGDSGTGERPQFEVADQMVKFRKDFPFDTVLMMGDNIYGSKTPGDFRKKFETPYQTSAMRASSFTRASATTTIQRNASTSLQYGWPALLHLENGQRPVLRAG